MLEKVLSDLSNAFPSKITTSDEPILALRDFAKVGSHLQKEASFDHIDLPSVKATAFSWAAVVASLAKETSASEEPWIHWELIFLCSHLELLEPAARSIVYPLCLREFLLSEARDEAQMGEHVLFSFGLDCLGSGFKWNLLSCFWLRLLPICEFASTANASRPLAPGE